MVCHSLLQGIFLTQGSNPGVQLWQADSLPTEPPGKPPIKVINVNWECRGRGDILVWRVEEVFIEEVVFKLSLERIHADILSGKIPISKEQENSRSVYKHGVIRCGVDGGQEKMVLF